jgi:hypothetical protein
MISWGVRKLTWTPMLIKNINKFKIIINIFFKKIKTQFSAHREISAGWLTTDRYLNQKLMPGHGEPIKRRSFHCGRK